MLKPIKTHYYLTLFQMLAILLLMAAAVLLGKDQLLEFFHTTRAGMLGVVLNGIILLIFLLGLARMIWLFLSYTHEQGVLLRFIRRAEDNAANPVYGLPETALVVNRYYAVQTIARQNAEVNQAALASTLMAGQVAQFTLVRFVNSILILAGVLGTVISLAVALMGAAGLMNTADNMKNMWDIIGGMSNSLSTTVTAIVCYLFFAYFYLRLQDARTQLLANIEDVTALYILPRFKHAENNLLHDVAVLAAELRRAAEAVTQIEDRFLHAGERLQLAVDDLQSAVAQSGDNIRIIRDSVREGFRLPVAGGKQPS
ncbi:hypothetical protein VSS37_14050 [Candidatus Thiothrix sp. Deng01]|uniref:MotA/TolQ/ExbB proton channel domain-containing protein n=1 Tax=Candidatus Thiothrix phosphatis TaxID=3112415 RepID=A0ABU6CZ52_9GAMM|nr:hypothetical protein [Candidatus Thiothrix sp. Deng01]MEB4592110.1 hypothetical protein [Candidatus Thiothrix sp. Deng01]